MKNEALVGMLMQALAGLAEQKPEPHKPPSKFTDQRKAEAEAKRQRKRAKRMKEHGHG